MKRCADQVDCGYENRDSELFCRACGLPLLSTAMANRYIIHALISKGGYAAVYNGVDQNLSRRVAVKVLLPSRTTPTEQEHFLREARIAATLDHPNIAPVLDYGKDAATVFLVMPLYLAGSLRTRLAQANGPLPASETIANMRQLGMALHYAHTRPRPVIHRDIKPENILIHPEDGRLMITDFGIARALHPGASFGKTITVRGTVGYMAPEQTSGIVDPRSDQFGCAVVLFEMLTGYHPLDPISSAIPAPSTFNGEIPVALDAVVLRALAVRPEERFGTMLEFVQAFDAARAGHASTKARWPDAQAPAVQESASLRQIRPAPPALTARAAREVLPTRQRAAKTPASLPAPAPHTTGSVREKCQEGDQLLKQHQYQQALLAYEEALHMDPDNFYAWNGKGTTLYSQGSYKKALEAYQRAIEIDSENPIVWVSAGLALNCLQRYQQGLVHFERALSLDRKSIAALNGRADAQVGLNMPEEALKSYEQALAYDPMSFQAWNGIGNVRMALREFAGAATAYTKALMVNPRNAVAWCNKAEALVRQGHNRAALDALDEAIEVDRSYARAWTLKAEVHESLGNPQEAEKARKRAKPWGLMNS